MITRSSGFRITAIGAIVLMLGIPLMLIHGQIRDREQMRDRAERSVMSRWATEQLVGGPMLVVPLSATVETPLGTRVEERRYVVLAETLDINADLKIDVRYYGAYETPVYVATIRMQGRIVTEALRTRRANGDPVWDQAELFVPVSDGRGLRSVEMLVDGVALDAEPGRSLGERWAAGLKFRGPVEAEAMHFDLKMELAGTAALSFLPLAETTVVRLAAPWPDPSFVGQYLPQERRIDAQQVAATWKVLALNRSFGQVWPQDEAPAPAEAAFGLELYQPVDIYQRSERATKYGLLFIALIFMTLFLLDSLSNIRLHPVQYLLVGLALACFFLVLLALAEHIGFGLAYLLAGLMLIAIVGGYSAAILRQRRRGVVVGAVLSLTLILLFWLLISEHYSLLVGSLALLGLLAAAMYATRGVDWYSDRLEAPAPISI